MNLNKYLKNGYLTSHEPYKKEILNLLLLAERDLRASEKLSQESDWQFAIAYNAALQLATIPIRVSGYRATTKVGHHWITFSVLPLLLGAEFAKLSKYLDDCRIKRNTAEYIEAGVITEEDASKLIDEVKAMRKKIIAWLKKTAPQFL